MSRWHNFDPFPERPVVTVSERVALSLQALGTAGQDWLAGLPGLLASLEADWSITVGARLDGGSAAYVAEAVTHDGTPVVVKVAFPPGVDGLEEFERQLAALRLAAGDPYVRMIRFDRSRRALLLERLGRPMASLGWPASRQMDALVRTAARGWRPVPDGARGSAGGRLPDGAECARWLADFISSAWADLDRPCPESVVDLAVRCAAAREAAFDPDRAVLVHGDVHALNALRTAGSGFRLVDPEGLVSEPAHDLGVIQARGVQGWIDELADADPRPVFESVTGSCRRAGRLAGVDPEAVWQWAFIELVSTGLFVLSRSRTEEGRTFLAVAGKLAAASATDRAVRTVVQAVPTPILAAPTPTQAASGGSQAAPAATLWLMVGLPGAGKTTRARELAAEHRALRLTPDEWMIPLFGASDSDGKRDILEGRLITVALRALRLGTGVVLDFGLWGRDERSALRRLAESAGASCEVVYLPVGRDVQRARIAHRQATAAHETYPIGDADIDRWRQQFQPPDTVELGGGRIPDPPPGWADWAQWAADRWPSLATDH